MRASFMPPNWGRIAQEPTFPAPHSSGCHLRSGSLSFFPYIGDMLWRNRRGRPLNAPAAFIHPCQPIVAKQPPIGPGWAHELKHDGYRLQIHVRGGRVRVYRISGYDWSNHYPLIVEEATRLNVTAIMDAEVICTDGNGVPTFEKL